ncbi:MAG: spore coat protein CotJB, partial [Clostridiales bacterium]|nr:spore coat protein CotJB [Clostridiales bacterium]
MLRQVDEAGFAVVDANLYLDTHPCDASEIDFFNQILAAYHRAAAAYV